MSNILLIDDNPLNNIRYIDDLRKRHSVEVAMKLISAERLLKRPFDIIIIDVMMPTQNLANHHDETTTGFAFYRQKVAIHKPDCIVVFWSRIDDKNYRNYWITHQINPPKNTYFVHKTNYDGHLRERIDEILKQNNLFY